MILSRLCLSIAFGATIASGIAGLAWAQAPAAPAQATTRPEINAPLPGTPDEIIAFRKANYKWMGDTFEDMKKAIAAGADVAPFAPKAADMVAWAHRVPTVFPVGTETGHDTKALPAVWSDHPVFETRAAALATEAAKLSTVAATGDKAAFADQYKTTGAACGACHREFRAR